MIVGELTELDIDPALIEMTSWEVSKYSDFREIVAQSLNDTTNLTSIIFEDVDVPAGIQYYGRARICIKDAGWNTINNVSIIVSEANDGVVVENMLPTIIPAPRISMYYNNKLCDIEQVPTLYAIIKVQPQDLVGDNKVDTYLYSYFILDSEGHVIYKLEKTKLAEIQIVEDFLAPNKVYTVQVACITSVGETSPLGCLTFSTTVDPADTSLPYFLYAFSQPVDVTKQIQIKVPYDVGVGMISIDLYLVANGEFLKTYSQVIDRANPYFNIPANTLVKGSRYKVELNRDGNLYQDVFVVL